MHSVKRYVALASAFLICGLAGCGNRSDPQKTAEALTQAVYADDLVTAVGSFDAQTQPSLNRGDLGRLSDLLHGYGDYRSLSQLSGDANTGQYTYSAAFTRGTVIVLMRLDADGKVGAYRIRPVGTPAASVGMPRG